MHPLKILIVEDEFIVANQLRRSFERAGHLTLGIGASVEQALKLIERQRPDWVVLDTFLRGTLGGIDLGMELTKQRLPFIFISAHTDPRVLDRVKMALPYGFLVKPFREEDLLATFNTACQKHALKTGTMSSANYCPGRDIYKNIGEDLRPPVW